MSNPAADTNKPARHSRVPLYAGLALMGIALWLCAVQIAATISGGLAIVPPLMILAGACLGCCGFFLMRRRTSPSRAFAVFAIICFLVSWFIFSDGKDWKADYDTNRVMNQYGTYDECDIQGQDDFHREHQGDFYFIPDMVNQAKKTPTGASTLLCFKLGRFVRLAFCPPLAYLWTKGCPYTYNGGSPADANNPY